MAIDPEILRQTIESWQAVPVSAVRAASIAADVGRFNDAALKLAVIMPFESEPATFEGTLARFAEE